MGAGRTQVGSEESTRFCNVAVVRGYVAGTPQQRELAAGAATELTVRVPGDEARPSENVPVVWIDAPARVADLVDGLEVLVVGRVRRRFYRSAAGTRSTTEVVADAVVPARRAAAARRLIERAAAGLSFG